MKFPLKNIQFLTALLVTATLFMLVVPRPDIKIVYLPSPQPNAMSPNSGYAGFAEVTITGSQFGDFKNAVKVFFNGILSDTILSCEDGRIVARVPANAVNNGKVGLRVWTSTVDSVGELRDSSSACGFGR